MSHQVDGAFCRVCGGLIGHEHDAQAHSFDTVTHGGAMTPKVRCPACGHATSKVTDCRPSLSGGVYRRRQCLACRQRFTTEETLSKYAQPRKRKLIPTSSSQTVQ